MLKALLFLEIFTLLSRFFAYVEKRLEKKNKKNWLISKFMMSKTGQQIIAIHILHNVARSKGNQVMKLGQFIKCSMINIFLQQLCRK